MGLSGVVRSGRPIRSAASQEDACPNSAYRRVGCVESRAESIRRFRILGTDFTETSGQLTPTLKLRRDVVAREFAADIEALYSPAG